MSEVREEVVDLGDGLRLAVRVTPADVVGEGGHARAGAVLVHGLASNAQMWDACAQALAAGGVTCVAPDLRGHGRTARLPGPDHRSAGSGARPATPAAGTPTAAADVTALVAHYQLDGTLPPPLVLVGQSWGGNVVLSAAAGHAGQVDALALVDGGWLRFATEEPFDTLWERMAPPGWGGTTWDEARARIESTVGGWGPHALPAVLANLRTEPEGDPAGRVRNVLDLDAHEQILRSMYDADPRALYPSVTVPVLLVPAGGGPASAMLDEALAGLPDPRLRRYDGAHHDLHLQHPQRLADDLLELLDEISMASLPSEGDR